MKNLAALVLLIFLTGQATATDMPKTPSELLFETRDETDLEQFVWIKRPIVVFADTPADPRFAEQVELLEARAADLLERDVVVLLDADARSGSDLRRKLRPRGFMLVIIGKDGGVKLRKPFPWDVREITRSIDKMPMRKQEMRGAAQSAD